jgi:hypothetical protein
METCGRSDRSIRIFSNPSAFTKLRGEVSASYGGRFVTDLQLNARSPARRTGGDTQFFESAFIGGAAQKLPLDLTGASTGNLLRGYTLNRFAGDASVVGNAELQVALGRFNAALPFRFGVLGLADVGCVFVANQSSSRSHTGYGGGFWLGPFISATDFHFASGSRPRWCIRTRAPRSI